MPTPAALMGLSSPGDTPPYPQYSRTYTMPISSGLDIAKGELYTVNTSGELILPTLTEVENTADPPDGRADFGEGVFQAVDSVSSGDADDVQVLGRGSRILFYVENGVSKGNLVSMGYANTPKDGGARSATSDWVIDRRYLKKLFTTTGNRGIRNTVGTVIEIKSDLVTPKFTATTTPTASVRGDLAIIELGGY